MMNWDQTGSNYVPENNCTVDFEGVKKIALPHNDDKRQITFFLFGFTMVGLFIPPKLEYQVKSDSCHPRAPLWEGLGFSPQGILLVYFHFYEEDQ